MTVDNNSSGNAIAILYINGKKDVESSGITVNISGGKIFIGGNPNLSGSNFTGLIDEVRISNFTKSITEINSGMHIPTQLFSQPIIPKTTLAYGFDGTLASSTGKGYRLFPLNGAQGAQYNFNTETPAPLFVPNENLSEFNTRTNFTPFHFSSPNPEVIWDSLYIDSNVVINSDLFRTFVSIDHASITDIKLTLYSPSGDSVLLMDKPITAVQNITAILDTQRALTINNSIKITDASPQIGCYQLYTPLNGKLSKGWWRLKLTDAAKGNQGQLFSWGLKIKGKTFGVNIQSVDDETTHKIYTKVYPNPFTENLEINSNQIIKTIEIFDLMGKKIWTKNYSEKSVKIDLKDIPSGIYLLKIFNPHGPLEIIKINKE